MDVDIHRIEKHIARIAATPRSAESAELEAAREYVARELSECGWSIERLPFRAVTDMGGELGGINLVCRHPTDHASSKAKICIGAHLDSRPDSPGADDNASAVAALLEIARLLPREWPADSALSLELAVFDLEENGMLGGAEHARRYRDQGIPLAGMVSLEMLGYCDHRPGSQQLPRTLVGMYPDTGNFIAVIGNQISGPLIGAFSRGMRRVAELPVETLQVPENGQLLQASRLSDHSPFWDAGYPALMITDTSFLRNPHYHHPTDTLDTLDLRFLHHVAEGCVEAVRLIIREGLSEGT